MEIRWQAASQSEWKADAIMVFAFESEESWPTGVQSWLDGSGGWLAESQALQDFRRKWQEVVVCYAPVTDRKIPRAIVVGLGKQHGFDLDKWRGAVATGLRKCRDLRLSRPALAIPTLEGLPFPTEVALREALIGGLLGLYRFDRWKTKDRDQLLELEGLELLKPLPPEGSWEGALAHALAVWDGVQLARDLVTAPANQVTPAFLVQTARDLAQRHGLTVDVIDQTRAEELGMGSFLAVAQGSREPAYMVVLEHAPAGKESDPPLVFVGKGITFDTGGISIKPSDKMELMKHDMAGAAAVLGAFAVLGRLGVPQRVIGIIPCTENMPDGKAYKPGDVIRSLAGLTIEVISTDAEGRMVLCDALTYGQRFQPAAMVDVATLTGACIIALGDQVGAVMGNRGGLVTALQELATAVGERLWPLPLWDFYQDDLKSDVADCKNVGAARKAGSIIGGMFLKQFVPDEIPWVHLDIAGPAWADKDLPIIPKGGTGFGVRLLAELAMRWTELKIE
ncbi:MAG TPA: leucyl aminopeptidase [Syntrophobacteraceae bacterium]|nr:leucyl aminopeptidase [Syntrophobacteraceae bacterium]